METENVERMQVIFSELYVNMADSAMDGFQLSHGVAGFFRDIEKAVTEQASRQLVCEQIESGREREKFFILLNQESLKVSLEGTALRQGLLGTQIHM